MLRTLKVVGVLLVGATVMLASRQIISAQQSNGIGEEGSMITYSRGQPIIPIYNGWHPNKDGSIDMWFGYLNNNWREEPDVQIGANNNISAPFGPDAGQPTHFFPRNNRFIFKITVDKSFADKEVVWTLTTGGKTLRAYATLHPAYIRDDSGMQREYFGGNGEEQNDPPVIEVVEGPKLRTAKVDVPVEFKIKATDDHMDRQLRPRGQGPGAAGAGAGAGAAGAAANQRRTPRPSICGTNTNPFFCGEYTEGGGNLSSVKGLRMQCFLYRGDPEVKVARNDFGQGSLVTFDPPQEKVWEDHRGGSPWATGWVLPPLPKDNIWVINATFAKSGTYGVRCQAHDGTLVTNTDLTFEVTQ